MTTIQPTAFIEVGKPGGGKGTVLTVLKKRIEALNKSVFTSDTGEMFRKMIKNEPDTIVRINDQMRERIAKINDSGRLQVSSLAGSLWTTLFGLRYQWEEPYIIMDGSPRRGVELDMLEEFLTEFIEAKIRYICIETDDEVVVQRMLERHKKFPRPETSSKEAIMTRLTQYDKLVKPTIEKIKDRYEGNWLLAKEGLYTIDNNGSLLQLEAQVNEISL